MRAFVLTAAGPEICERPLPVPGDGQVLLRVRAAALNRADLALASGRPYGDSGGVGTVLGMECAGEVCEVGAGVSGIRIGDRLMSVAAGAFAEYAVADYLRAYQIPQSFAFETAASLPTSLSTTHNALLTEGRLEPGQTILVQGASAAVGLMVMQVAKLKGAALVIGTSTNAERRSRLSEHGADLALDSSDRAWIDRVQDATGGTGVDLVIDFVSGATANLNLEATRIGGRIVNVGRLGGAMAKFDFNLHALRRITYIGVTARTRSRAEIAAISDGVRADLLPAVAERRLALPIDRVFAFSEAAEALAHMRQNRHFGKIVLSM